MTIRYHDKNDKIGSIAWRNNNPGNLVWGSSAHATKTGCIGKARGRPVVPDYETGKHAMRLLLKEDFYQRLTLNELPRKYNCRKAVFMSYLMLHKQQENEYAK